LARVPAPLVAARMDKVLILIPTYNDFARLGELIGEIERSIGDARILVIDDGSAVPIDLNSSSKGVLYVRLPDNYGLGVCMQVAFDHALYNGYDSLVRVDADGQHPVSSVPDFSRYSRVAKPMSRWGCASTRS
jgi:dolichol-phosphate mannosyltransferase